MDQETTSSKIEAVAALTKSQLKRKLKLENILKKRAEKRKHEREKRKKKKLERKLNQEQESSTNEQQINRKQLKRNRMCDSDCKLRIVVDCSFEEYMSDNDLSHLCKQLSFCYATNRRLKAPIQLYITDYNKKFKEALSRVGGSSWDLHLKEENFLKLFENEFDNLVYLTSDSDNVIDDFNDNNIYIIGGLVDHNHHKSLCYNLALNNKIKHAQLPIGQYMHMKTRQVLTVNQVFDIIAKYTQNKNWKEAFLSVLPKRKGAHVLDTNNDEQEKVLNESIEESTNK